MARRSSADRYSNGSAGAIRRVTVVVPMPVGLRPRIAYYKYPSPRQRSRRVIRQPLGRRGRYVLRKVAVVVPRTLPTVRGSYVSVDRYHRLNIHSHRQLRSVLDREYHRERYSEDKRNRRSARNGQLESVRADRAGIIGAAAAMGVGAAQLADTALVSRALGWS